MNLALLWRCKNKALTFAMNSARKEGEGLEKVKGFIKAETERLGHRLLLFVRLVQAIIYFRS